MGLFLSRLPLFTETPGLKRWWRWLAAANGAYALFWFVWAGARVPFWYDELFTVRLSGLPTMRALWKALAAGLDFNPPGLYLVTRLARLAPLADPLASRLPALTGFALLMAALFVFLSRRVGPAVATSAVALMGLSNFVERYAIEARAYMPLLGVSACALVCWQSISQMTGRRRRAAAWGLWCTVTIALTLHVWALILPAAILAGELVLTARSKTPRWMVIGALAAAAPVLAMYPSLLSATKTVSLHNIVYAPAVEKLTSAWLDSLPRLRALVWIAVAVICARVAWRRQDAGVRTQHAEPGLASEEQTVFIVLALSPLVPYLYAWATNGAFMPRYGMFVVIGIGGLLAELLFRACRRSISTATTVGALASVLLWILLPARMSSATELPALRVLRASPMIGDTPVVLVNPLDVLAVDERAAPQERQALRFVADPALALRYTGADLMDGLYLRGERELHIGIPRLTYEDLTSSSWHLYLLGAWQPLSWLPRRLADDGWTMTGIGGSEAAPLFDARRK